MKKTYILGLLLLGGLCVACGETDEEKQAKRMRQYAEEQARKRAELEKIAKDAEKKRQERDAKGDTVALSQAKLEGFLPANYQNYQKMGEPIVSNPERNGSAFSTAEQNYQSGDRYVRLTVRDSNQGANPQMGMSKLWAKRPQIKSREGWGRYLILPPKVPAWISYSKREKRAEVLIEVSDRIFITVLGTNHADTEDVLGFAKLLDLGKLAKY